MHNGVKTVILAVSALLLFRCSDHVQVNAGTSVSGNAKVSGTLYYGNGVPATNVKVSIIPADYDPRLDTALPASHIVVTDSNGNYSFTISDTGSFNIQSIDSAPQTVLIKGVHFSGTPVNIPADTLRSPGAIKMTLPEGIDSGSGYVYIPGTTLSTDAIEARNGFVFIKKVPPGPIPNLTIAPGGAHARRTVEREVVVDSADTTLVVNPMFRYRMRLTLNTTPKGAGVSGNVNNFPVLIRLSQQNFDFTQVQANGEDIRFNKSNGAPLFHEIESWDSRMLLAELWVRVDTIFGNNDSQYIVMYWGNSNAVSGSNGYKVFDTANGFQGVWHLAGQNYDTAFDATANRNHGIPCFSRMESVRVGSFGFGRFFNGSGCIVMPQTATGKLDVPPGGNYTISAWISVGTYDTTTQIIAGKGKEEYSLVRLSEGFNSRWEMTAAATSVADITPAFFNGAYLVVGVSNGLGLSLYVNGAQVQSPSDSSSPFFPIVPRSAKKDFTIGGVSVNGSILTQDGAFFSGFIDEVQFSNVARSADWIRLGYMNQQFPDMLVVFNYSMGDTATAKGRF